MEGNAMSWLRWWDGTVTDPKWRVVAARSKQPVGNVLAVWAFVLEEARRHDGALPEMDCEVIGACLGYDPDDVFMILQAMRDKGSLCDGGVTNWRKRQPKREDDSRARVTAWREKKKNETQENARQNSVTHGNAPEAEAEAEKSSGFETSSKPSPNQKKVRTEYPEGFAKFWAGYPTDANMSKKEAFDVWKRISDENRQLALESLPAFRSHCTSNPDYRPIHACRYLSKERFAGHVATAQKLNAQRFVEIDTPQWVAWQEHLMKTRGKGSPVTIGDANGKRARGWTFEAEWPPGSAELGIAKQVAA
jgi:hypothetical protein